jgi:hypothetical protein
MATFSDNIKWFHKHVSSTYQLLETALPMADVAMYTIKHIKRLIISRVSNKVKSDLFRVVVDPTARQKAISLHSTLNQSLRAFLN